MKRNLLPILSTVFVMASLSLLIIQIVQTRRSAEVSESLFTISVSNVMDDVIDQLNRLKVESYIDQQDRYRLLKYKRLVELNEKMQQLLQSNATLMYDDKRVAPAVSMQDSIIILPGVQLSPSDSAAIDRYNTLLDTRNRLQRGSGFYDQFVNDISVYVVDNIMSSSSFKYSMLDSLICDKLLQGGIDIRPLVGVINNSSGDFIYQSDSLATSNLLQSPYRYDFRPDGLMSSSSYTIVLYFPRSALLLRDSLSRYFVLSIALMFISVLSFLITMRLLRNQRIVDEMKTDFINNMTHEIKTPISTISLAVEMMRDPTVASDSTSASTYLGIIGNENRRMQVLVETILQSAKMGNKSFSIELTPTDMHQLISEVASSFSMVVSGRGGRIDLRLEADESVVSVDKLHVTNMLSNMIDNAIKYSPDELYVEIATRKANGRFVISITDHGKGISKQDQKHIFEKFYRVSTGDVHDVKGFGIGLNYVMQVVKLHGGEVDVESELARGSTFTIFLPLS